MLRLINKTNNQVLAQNVIEATTFFSRTVGLMGKKDMLISEAFWIKPCWGGIHTFFMHFPIDLIFVTKALQVSAVFQHVLPWRIMSPSLFSKTHSVFELKSQALKEHHIQIGEQLYVGN